MEDAAQTHATWRKFKRKQHSNQLWRKYGYDTVLTYILDLGGLTYTSNMKTMKALGIEGTAAKTLSRKTHEYSVVWA